MLVAANKPNGTTAIDQRSCAHVCRCCLLDPDAQAIMRKFNLRVDTFGNGNEALFKQPLKRPGAALARNSKRKSPKGT